MVASTSYGPYTLVRSLGGGGVGEVYLAVDSTNGANVALKLLPLPRRSDTEAFNEARGRFLVEAYATRKLQHPYIAAVLNAGETNGQAWIAMELAPGSDLTRYARAPRLLPEAMVLRVASRVAAALACAHEAGIVHRDVKASNVIVDWATDSLKLTDFGIARSADSQVTRTGFVPGTPAYQAPEQLAGALPGERGDLYGLGVLMFELLAGQLPFEAPTMGQLLRKVAQEPAPDLRSLQPDVSEPTARFVAGLLAKDPAARPWPASRVATYLGQLAVEMAGKPAAATTAGPMSRR
jgi:eukaryotic-like serine/threonine-protein kinase